jgi:hypothetical protein
MIAVGDLDSRRSSLPASGGIESTPLVCDDVNLRDAGAAIA